MPRVSPKIARQARSISKLLPPLLRANKDLNQAQLELSWIKRELPPHEWVQAVQQRSRLVPLQYILKSQPFGSLTIGCREGVLVPRWETEEWCTKLSELLVIGLKNTKDEIRIVDACTGTGCIPLLLNHELSQAGFKTDIHGFDVSGKAYDLAMENLSRVHGQADGNVTFQLGDVFNARVLEQIGVTKPVDLITANPPYIPIEEYEKPLYHQGIERSVKLYEPKLALVGDWEFYYNLLEHVVLPSHAKGFVFELGYQEQADFVHKYLKDNPFWQVGSRDDSRQNIRCVIGWKKGTDYEILQKLCDFIY